MKTSVNNISNESKNQVNNIVVGDRVKVRGYDTPADVVAITAKGYKVKFLKPVRNFWTLDPMREGEYSRSAITKNYDPRTGEEIEGNAQYYREQLTGDWWEPGEPREYELAGVRMSFVPAGNDTFYATTHHENGKDTADLMHLDECAEWLSRLYTIDKDPSKAHDFDPPKPARLKAEVLDGIVVFVNGVLLFDLIEMLGGMPEGAKGAFKCTRGDFYDAVQNIGVHIDCPEVYDPDEHDMAMQAIRHMDLTAYEMGILLNVIWTMADASDGYIYFKAA